MQRNTDDNYKYDLKNLFLETADSNWHDVFDLNILDQVSEKLNNDNDKARHMLEFFPPPENIFNAFTMKPSEIKVYIIGQDPYKNEGEANGYAFSVNTGITVPPSVQNIKKEIHAEYKSECENMKLVKNNGDLTFWANQGVMMMNVSLTLRSGQSNSHKTIWAKWAKHVIQRISEVCDNIIFIAWGKSAQGLLRYINDYDEFGKNKYIRMHNKIFDLSELDFVDETFDETKNKEYLCEIDIMKHIVLTSGHPSPLSIQYFKGNGHFKSVNAILSVQQKEPIDWISEFLVEI